MVSLETAGEAAVVSTVIASEGEGNDLMCSAGALTDAEPRDRRWHAIGAIPS